MTQIIHDSLPFSPGSRNNGAKIKYTIQNSLYAQEYNKIYII